MRNRIVQIFGRTDSERMLRIAMLCFLIASTATFATTTISSRSIIEPLRNVAAGLTVFFVAISLILSPRLRARTAVAVAAFMLFVSYGLLLHLMYGNTSSISFTSGNLLISFAALLLFAQSKGDVISRSLTLLFVCYALLMLIFTIALGGLPPSLPPQFNLEYATQSAGTAYDIRYSQGITKFFGISAVLTAILLIRSGSRTSWLCWAVLTLLFLGLSFIGGARGDSVGALLVVTISLLRNSKRAMILLGVAFGAAFIAFGPAYFSDWTIIQRFSLVFENAARRQELLLDSLMLFQDQPSCLLAGCGFNYFQYYYNYPFTLYPHNLIAEMLVSFGAILTLIFLLLIGYGLKLLLNISRNRDDAFPYLLLYFLFIGMKSGSIVTSWFLMGGLFFLVGMVIARRGGVGLRSASKKSPPNERLRLP